MKNILRDGWQGSTYSTTYSIAIRQVENFHCIKLLFDEEG